MEKMMRKNAAWGTVKEIFGLRWEPKMTNDGGGRRRAGRRLRKGSVERPGTKTDEAGRRDGTRRLARKREGTDQQEVRRRRKKIKKQEETRVTMRDAYSISWVPGVRLPGG